MSSNSPNPNQFSDPEDAQSDDTTVGPSRSASKQHVATLNLRSSRNPETRSPTSPADGGSELADRVFPIRSVVGVGSHSGHASNPSRTGGLSSPYTPAIRSEYHESYFQGIPAGNNQPRAQSRKSIESSADKQSGEASDDQTRGQSKFQQALHQIVSDHYDHDSLPENQSATGSTPSHGRADDRGVNDGYMTTRFSHIMTENGHAVITGRAGDPLQRCEDEPIHIPGAVQSFGLLIALAEEDGKFIVRVVSENSKDIIGYTPMQLFALENFLDIFTEEQGDNLLDHIDFVRDEETDVEQNGPEVFTISIRGLRTVPRSIKLWCAMHINKANRDLIILEFELENDTRNPMAHPIEEVNAPEDTLRLNPTAEELEESTISMSKPLRVLRSARRGKGEAAAMEVFNVMSQIQEQMAAAYNLEAFLKILVGVVKELTGFHRVMIYQFDKSFNGRVVTELVDARTTKDLYRGLQFPASDIPKQARDLYKINRVRILYDRAQETARLVCRTVDDLESPLDLTHSYLRAMSPIHIKYLENMAVRASMSISINAFGELWGLISCHSYGSKGMRVAFPIRKMCRLIGDTASRNIERLSYASRLQARKLINTVPTRSNPSGYIIASSEDLLRLFNADFGLLCINDEAKMLGQIDHIQEALVMLEYLKARKISTVTACQDIREDFPDLTYQPKFQVLAGMLLVPLTASGTDFICFFRRGQLREVKWAGNPYEKLIRKGTSSFLEPRKSFQTWSETVVGKCRDWTEDEIETAAVLCLVYGKFIDVWRQKEAALENSQLTKLLLANSAHEVRTPLNAIINYLEIALEGPLETDTREYLAKSHSASKSLIYVINDLLDLTKTEQGGDLVANNDMDLPQTLTEATNAYSGDAKRKSIEYQVTIDKLLPTKVIGDSRKVRTAISNIVANAIKHTSVGSVTVDAYIAAAEDHTVHLEVVIQDTGVGMSAKKLDALFLHLEQVQSDPVQPTESDEDPPETPGDDGSLGLGLAVAARIIRNMNGQLRLKSDEGQGSRFVISLPFELAASEIAKPDRAASVVSTRRKDSDESLDLTQTAGSPPIDPNARSASLIAKTEEVLLVDRGPLDGLKISGSGANSTGVSRRESTESLTKSLKSVASGNSARSDVDRLIEALQEPHMVEAKRWAATDPGNMGMTSIYSGSSSRPTLRTSSTYNDAAGVARPAPLSPVDHRSSRPKSFDETAALLKKEETQNFQSENVHVSGQSRPIQPVRIPTPDGLPIVSGLKQMEDSEAQEASSSKEPPNAEKLTVLVAEDDPVNSKIIKKRLERLGHSVHLTVNGEDCAAVYEDHKESFDVILMDMQVCTPLDDSYLTRTDAHCRWHDIHQNDSPV
jgi:light-regulated signal transduction histidine kinase (bacteriophytochrome)